VVREQLCVVLRAPETLEPFGREPMLLCAHRSRDLPVRDLLHKHVEEGVFGFGVDG
jgi:hypothetical protein